jgi:hypothetical protein
MKHLIERRSPFSGEFNTMEIDFETEDYIKWRGGTLIQNAFPYLTPNEREFLITGITPEEWAKEFGEQSE